MKNSRISVLNASVTHVKDSDYFNILHSMIFHSCIRCLCLFFIVDTTPGRDQQLKVDRILTEMSAARWRGVNVRLIIGGSQTNMDIALISESARLYAGEVGIPCRWLTSKPRQGNHMKLVIADNYVLTGSHNLSGGALSGQIQDSILVESAPLACYFTDYFNSVWQQAD